MKPKILSPLTGLANTEQIGDLQSAEIVSIYQHHFGIDVSDYFSDTPKILIMRCRDTGFMFYYPFTLEGDEAYYARMSEFEWYYHPNRWEHQKARELIDKSDRILEVGSGSGLFMKKLADADIAAYGLELNPRGVANAEREGIKLINQTIEDHAQAHANEYDVVCSFQVLEHVANPLSFLQGMLRCLKKGGKLIVGVPNNDSYIFRNKMPNKVLNMPPHHVGLWTYESLESLQRVLGIKLREVYYEPLVDGNVGVYLWNKTNSFFLEIPFFTRAIWKLKLDRVMTPILNRFSDRIRGASMLAVFTRE